MAEQEKWQWQKSGTAWRGIGVYHVTLTVPSREPLFGTLVIPEGNPSGARIERTPLGNAVVNELYVMCRHYPEVRILQFCLMPDHLHAVIQVTRVMETSIRSVIRGYWQGVKKLGRAHTLAVARELNSEPTNEGRGSSEPTNEGRGNSEPTNEGRGSSEPTNEGRGSLEPTNEGRGSSEPTNEGSYPFPIFTERPFIRPLSRRGQLRTMIRYVQMNPQRLATKRLKPGYFHVQKDIEIGNRKYDGVGNVALLMASHYEPVHVRSVWVNMAKQDDTEPLRNYMNGCVLAARKGVVMVSPFISPQEKQVMQVLLQEGHPFILLTDNGFRDYYKPADVLFDACAAGRLLILSPWPYDEGKRHISRAECVALNAMAEEICQSLNGNK
jgi:REP element-mobilizing transposase RayT